MRSIVAIIAVTLGYFGLWYNAGWEVALSIWAIGAGYAELVVRNRIDQEERDRRTEP